MKKMKVVIFFLIPFYFVFHSCKEADITEPEPVSIIDNYPWQYGSYQELALDESLLNTGFNAAQTAGYINGIVIMRNGKIAAERYYNNNTTNTAFDVMSVTKSYLSAAVGNAIKRNYFTTDTKLIDIFPELKDVNPDYRINNITIYHLLTMTSGIKGDEYFNSSFTNSDQWVREVMTTRLENEPGSVFRYSETGVCLLSAALSRKTNQISLNFEKSTIFNYLNITFDSPWANPLNIQLFLTLKSMALLGVLYLNNGVYNYRPVVPADWITASVRNYFGTQASPRGKMINRGYGYLWWTGEMGGHRVFAAMGYGGQLIVCVPDINMVVGTSAPSNVNDSQAEIQMVKAIELIADYFIPAAIN